MLSPNVVKKALELWTDSESEESPLKHLRLVKIVQHQKGCDLHLATQEVITQALKKLEYKSEQLARLLRLRFLDQQAGFVVANQFNIAEATLYRSQEKAIKYLTSILQEQEEELKQEHQTELERRLEPATYEQLIGVEDHIQTIVDRLTAQRAPWVMCIEGLGGSGKTSLADAICRRVIKDDLFDDLAWISARQRSMDNSRIRETDTIPVLSKEVFVEQVLTQLGGTLSSANPLQWGAALSKLQSRLKGSRHLIVIDNLESVTDIKGLLPTLRQLANPSKFLLTSRVVPTNELGISLFHLPELSEQASIDLVRQEAQSCGFSSLANIKEDVLKTIYETVGGNPLALRLVVGQTRVYSLGVILNNLAAAVGERSELLYTFIYHHAWNSLSPRSRDVFLAMVLASSRGSSRDFLLDVTELAPADLDNALDHLVSLNLVDSAGNELDRCYSIHHLTRTFLRSKTRVDEEVVVNLDNYSLKFQDYLARSIQRITKNLSQSETAFLLPDERDHALQILNDAFKDPAVWSNTRVLLLELAPKMEQAGYRDEWIPYLKHGVQLSQVADDQETTANLCFHLGILFALQAKYNEACLQLENSETYFQRLGLSRNQAQVLNRLAQVARRQCRFKEAERLVDKALNLLEESEIERAYSYLVLGTVALDRHSWSEAAELFRKAYFLWQTENNKRMMAWSLTDLGIALRGVEKHEESIETYKQAIALYDEVQDPINEAVTHMNLGYVYLELQQPELALVYFETAEPTFYQVQENLRLGEIYNDMGIAYRQLHNWAKAQEFFLRSIKHFKFTGNTTSLIRALDGLGLVYIEQGELSNAKRVFEEALDYMVELKDDPYYSHLFNKLTEHLAKMTC